MHDYTNLGWPEAPFGADQRPFGLPSDILAAFAVEWAARRDERPVPVGVAAVCLRVRRHGPAQLVDAGNLSIGFRATVIENTTEVPNLLALLDRALTRARRHATILAGHHLDSDLNRMTGLCTVPLRGVAGVLTGWANRDTRERGMALMVDTDVEARPLAAHLDVPLDPLPVPLPDTPTCCAAVAQTVLTRGLAIGLTAAVYAGRYQWEGTFPLSDVIDREAWDILGQERQDHAAGGPPRAPGRGGD